MGTTDSHSDSHSHPLLCIAVYQAASVSASGSAMRPPPCASSSSLLGFNGGSLTGASSSIMGGSAIKSVVRPQAIHHLCGVSVSQCLLVLHSYEIHALAV